MFNFADEVKTESLTLKEVMRDKTSRTNLIIMVIIWSFGSFAFFLVPFYLQEIKADIYMLSYATEIAEFLASVICLFITRIMDLKKAMFLFCTLVCISSVGMLLFFMYSSDSDESRKSNYINAGLIMLCNLGTVCAFDIAYLINPTLFPVLVLSTAYGACNVVGRFVSIFSPVVAKIPNPYPIFILIAFSGFCALLSLRLKKANI